MVKFEAKVIDPFGLHARPSSSIVSVASKFESSIKIMAKGQEGDLKSIMNIMALGVKKGDVIIVKVDGKDEVEALENVQKAFIENKLIQTKK